MKFIPARSKGDRLLPTLLWFLGASLMLSSPLYGQQAEDVMVVRQDRKASYSRPVIIEFEGVIDTYNYEYFRNRLARAESVGADLVIVKIDSPGGLAFESLKIGEALRDVTWAHTVAWVPREAISGAALMSLGCDEIVLGPQARFGDAGVIQYDPMLEAFKYVPAKAKSVIVRQARDLAIAKGKPPELAESMVDENAVVFYRRTAGEDGEDGELEYRLFLLDENDDDPMEVAKAQGLDLEEWKLIPDSGKGRILTLNGPTAVELGMGDFLAADEAAVLAELNAPTRPIVYRYNLTDHVVAWLTHPVITFLLIVIGLAALYIELSAPGIGVGGLISGLCAALFFWSRFFGGTAGWLEVIFFVAGIVFLAMEMFVIPGFGIAGIAGLGLLCSSVVLASQEFVIPTTSDDWGQLVQTLLVLVLALCAFLMIAATVSRRLGSIPLLGRFALNPPSDAPTPAVDKSTGKPVPQPHPHVSRGDWGKAESLLRPAGRALINGVSLDVVSDGSYIEPGRPIRVIEISGNRVVVSEVEAGDETVWQSSRDGRENSEMPEAGEAT